MRSALRSGDPPLIIDLCGGDVTMPEHVLDFADINPGIKQQSRSVVLGGRFEADRLGRGLNGQIKIVLGAGVM